MPIWNKESHVLLQDYSESRVLRRILSGPCYTQASEQPPSAMLERPKRDHALAPTPLVDILRQSRFEIDISQATNEGLDAGFPEVFVKVLDSREKHEGPWS